MSNIFPTASAVRAAYVVIRRANGTDAADAITEFYTWLESVKADAWAAGADAGYADGSEGRTGDDVTHNPHASTL